MYPKVVADKYLVTGVAGFIGNSIATTLLSQGKYVVGVDSFSELLYPRDVKEKRVESILGNPKFSFFEGEVQSLPLREILKDVDYIVNEAGLPGQILSWQYFDEYFRSNCSSVFHLYTCAQELGVKGFVQASTSSVYGESAVGDELQPLSPASPYGVTKLAAENLLLSLSRNTSMKTVMVRYFSVYGPGQRPDMGIYKFANQLLSSKPITVYGDGNQTRDFTYVDDAVQGTLLALENGSHRGIYNISGGRQTSINELLNIMERVAGMKFDIQFVKTPRGDQLNTFANTSKAQGELSWRPEMELEKGIELQINWHREL